MDKKITLLFLILLISLGSAQEEFVLGEGELSNQDIQIKQAQELILQTNKIMGKIQEIGVANANNLTQVAEYLEARLFQAETSLIITIIVVTLANQGLWWAVFLYFQGRGLVSWNRKK